MTQPGDAEKFEQLVKAFYPHSNLLRLWELEGGVSAQVTGLEIKLPGGVTRKVVVRRHGDADLKRNPHIARDEFRLLEILNAAGLATPQPLYVDQTDEIFPAPYIVIEYIEGKTEFAPANLPDTIFQLANHLSKIHNIERLNADLSFLPRQEEIYARKLGLRPARLDESLDEGRIRDVLEGAWPFAQRNEPVLLHGDYWPGNILWRDGQLVGIIDWEDAHSGDPVEDLAIGRLEILWAFGIRAMQSFTEHYKALTRFDFTDLALWDLCAALWPAFKLAEWATDAATEQRMRERHRQFVTQAFERLPR